MATKSKTTFVPPKWWECRWRRVPCGKDSCRLCGRINKRRRFHVSRGEDPDSLDSVFSDVHDSFQETLGMLHKDAKRLGIDLDNLEDVELPKRPDHKMYPIFNRANQWYKSIIKLGNAAQESYQVWPKSEEGKDLFWYPSIIVVKIARQLDNRWESKHGDEHADIDSKYVGYVLKESIAILKRALIKLSTLRSHQKVDFTFCLNELENMESDILKI